MVSNVSGSSCVHSEVRKVSEVLVMYLTTQQTDYVRPSKPLFYHIVRDLIWNNKVPMKCKKVLFNTYYVPILTY
jgi:hypothetical protein